MKQKLLNSIRLRIALLVALLCSLGTGSVWGQSDKSAVYISNVTLPTSGTSVSSCNVSIGGNTYSATKLGKNGSGASATITAPIGTKYIHIHIAAWKGKSTTLTVQNGSTTLLNAESLTADDGITGSSTTFTLSTPANATTNYYKVITLSTALTSQATITITANSERAVFWGVNTEEEEAVVTSLSVKTAPTKTIYEVGESLDMSGFSLDADGNTVSSAYTMTMGGAAIANGATLSSAGKKTITVAYGGKEVSQDISVGAVTSIAVTTPPTKTSYDTGDSFDPTGMVVTASLSTGELSDPDTWTKTVTGYTVDLEDDLTPSNTSVTITYATKTTTQTISVTDVAVTGVSVKASTTIEKNKTETLTPTFTPANATNKNVTWESSDESVATVTSAGVVTGVASGTANITVTTDDGGYTATCVVTVVNEKGGIDAPYSVAEIEGQETATTFGNDIYVTGYIVGSVKDNKCYKTTADKMVNTNLLLADTPNKSFTEGVSVSSNTDGLIPVELPSSPSSIRDNWGVASNNVIGYKVILKGNAQSYFGTKGIKGTSEISAVSVPATIGSTGWTTYVTPDDVTMPSGVKAYIATTVNTNTIHIEEVENVPANEPIILKASAGTYYLPVITSSTDDVSANILEASDGSVTGDGVDSDDDGIGEGTIYALGKKNGEVGFYLVADGVSVPASKAYLTIGGGSSVKDFLGFSFGDETKITETSESIHNSECIMLNEAGAVFDLSGRRVNKAQKGLYILNGRKVLVK